MPGQVKRLVILDALRAIAGLTVPLFHICEPFTYRAGVKIESYCGHGYLAVEFFLLLMGYMLGFAYDRRWADGMGLGSFFRRRLVRLHPLVVSGVLIGLAVALVQVCLGTPPWMPWFKDKTAAEVCLLAAWAMTMVPVFATSLLNPFNACSWTLYYEYAANVLYAVFVRHLGKRTLAVCTLAALFLWVSYAFHLNLNSVFGTRFAFLDRAAAVRDFSVVAGWGTTVDQTYCAAIRLALPFLLGLLLSRLSWKIRLSKGAFWICIAVFVAVLYTPHSYRLGAPAHPWVNGVFDLAAVAVVFPALILVSRGTDSGSVGLSGRAMAAFAFLAELSYPLYMSHYPFMSVYGWWALRKSQELPFGLILSVQAAVYVALVAFAWLVMRYWDRPLQRMLADRAKVA